VLEATITVGAASDTKQFTVAVTPRTLTTDLFISEYIEGSSNNKAIEIYNGTGAEVDLTPYTLKININNNTSWAATILDLTGTLADGEVLVIYNSKSAQAIKDVGDISDDTIANFNGDDAVGLFKNDVLIDLFGVFGEDPGSQWAVGDAATANYTLVRDPSVISPVATWNPEEWVAHPQDTFDYLGSHTVTGPIETVTTTFGLTDAGLTSSYADNTFTVDGVEFGFVQFGNFSNSGDAMQGKAYTGRIYNVNSLNIVEVTVVFDPDQQYDPEFTFFGGNSALEEGTELTATVDVRTYTYDFTDTDFTHFLIRNDNYALYIMEVMVTYIP
ncbi:MAG: lamin tail domain-containing protein, partial [Candidatus Izemoplasmatales bacterium]